MLKEKVCIFRYKFNNSKFCCGFFFFTYFSFRNQQDNLNFEFIGITLRLMQSVGSMNSALSMLISTHVHLDKLLLVRRNNEFESDFIYQIDKDNKSAIKMTNMSFRFFNSSSFFYENISLDFEKINIM